MRVAPGMELPPSPKAIGTTDPALVELATSWPDA
jgi:hypothetical protein